MIFNSLQFFIFFGIVFTIHWLLPAKLRWIIILISSIAFYAYAQPKYIAVPLAVAFISYLFGLAIDKAVSEKKKQRAFVVSAIIIVLMLVFFKYTNFISTSLTELFAAVTHSPVKNSFLINLAAPLGISYITFQSIGYLIEIKRGNHPAEKSFGNYVTYLLLFTKVIAGPVERAHSFLPQLKEQQPFSYDKFVSGAKQMLWGLFKKVVIADRLAIYVNAVYSNSDHHSGITLLFTSACYVFQIYADFSGYTDMALGFSRMLGYELMPNFNRPLLAKSVTEFWRRWHISLSSWFADYFYNPIAIAKRDWGIWAVIYACFVTFTVLGFWHGANWTFIVFGILQGLILAIEIFTKKSRKNIRKKIPAWFNDGFGILFTFGYFAFSSIFFRADTVDQAFGIIKKMLTFKGPLFLDSASAMIFMFLGIIYLTVYEFKKEFYDNRFTLTSNKHWLVRNGYYCFLIFIIILSGVFDGGEFIYFQF